jgi:hypothetical protein
MGEAKRRKQDAFSKAQLDQLERVVERAYKRTRTGIEAARAAATDAERGAHVAAIHEATGSIVG